MSFKDKIEARENILLASLEACKASGYKTFIWGNGLVAREFEERKLYKFDGKVVNREYYSEDMGKDVFCLEDVLENENEKVNLAIAFRGGKFLY